MNQIKQGSTSRIKDVANLMAYFPAGSFLIVQAINNANTSFSYYLTISAGIILIAYGYITAFALFPCKGLARCRKKLELTCHRYISAIVRNLVSALLLLVTITGLVLSVLDLRDHMILLMAGVVYIFIIIIHIVTASTSVFKNRMSLISLASAFGAIAIYGLFTKYNPQFITVYFILCFICFLLALVRTKKAKIS